MNASIVPTKTSAMISIVVTHAALPAGTPFFVKKAILTTSPPINEGVVWVTNSPASLADMTLPTELTFRPMNALMKYSNLKACKTTLPITDAVEIIKGTSPTANICVGDRCVNKNIISRGIMLAGIARRRQFKTSHPLVLVSYIIVDTTT